MNNENKLLNLIKQPHISEKANRITANRQYVFRVHDTATKIEIKQAVEKLFNVVVTNVRVCNVKPKFKRIGKANEGWRKGWKKAYVALKEENIINYETFSVEKG